MKIFAFSDEAAPDLGGQIAAMTRNRLDGTEIRGIDGRSITALTVKEAADVLHRLKDSGLSVWSIGSPIGKIPLDSDGYTAHLDLLRHTLELAGTLECKNLRMFSFYLPEGVKPEDCRNEVVSRLGMMAEIAQDYGVSLCHENEKGIYGDLASRCSELLDAVPSLRCVFDPANFIQCGQDVPQAWALLSSRVYYLHIKDALADGTVVPAGRGIAGMAELLRGYMAAGGCAVTVEPHLRVFDGLASLERGRPAVLPEGMWPTADAAFDAACSALKELI